MHIWLVSYSSTSMVKDKKSNLQIFGDVQNINATQIGTHTNDTTRRGGRA